VTLRSIAAYASFILRVERNLVGFDHRGKAFSKETGELLAKPNRNGYFRITFQHGGHRFHVMEHVALWIYINGRWPRRGQQVNHKDLNRANGHYLNLELCSQSTNMRHSYKMRRNGHKGGKR
jgi:hypothetical protein